MKKKWYKSGIGIGLISLLSIILMMFLILLSYDITKQKMAGVYDSDVTSSVSSNNSRDKDVSDRTSDDSTTDTDSDSSSDDSSSDDEIYNVGDKVGYTNGLSFKVDNVQYYNGNDTDTPDQGNRYVIVQVTLKNDSDDEWDYNPYDFKLNADGNSVDTDDSFIDGPYENISTLDAGSLDPKATKTSYLIGQAPINAKTLQLRYQLNYKSDVLSVNLN